MKLNSVVFWSVLGVGAAVGTVIIARHPNPKVRLKIKETALMLKDLAEPVMKEMLTVEGETYKRLRSELDVLKGHANTAASSAKDIAIDQLQSVQDKTLALKEQAQLGLYSAQYKAESIKDQVAEGLHSAQDKAQTLKGQVQEGLNTAQERASALKGQAQVQLSAAQEHVSAAQEQAKVKIHAILEPNALNPQTTK
jgi:hypothetical protein